MSGLNGLISGDTNETKASGDLDRMVFDVKQVPQQITLEGVGR
jgi:hypothetical protein